VSALVILRAMADQKTYEPNGRLSQTVSKGIVSERQLPRRGRDASSIGVVRRVDPINTLDEDGASAISRHSPKVAFAPSSMVIAAAKMMRCAPVGAFDTARLLRAEVSRRRLNNMLADANTREGCSVQRNLKVNIDGST
jgi:hypothetical protein